MGRQAKRARRAEAPARPLDDDQLAWAVIGTIVAIATLSLWVPAVVLALA